MENNLPEAPVTMFTNYKRTDGFEVSLTLRGGVLKDVAKGLDDAIKLIAAHGGTPVTRQKTTGFAPKPKDYAEGECPKCQGRLIKGTGKVNVRCENNKWDFTAKKNVGTCEYLKWNEMTQADL